MHKLTPAALAAAFAIISSAPAMAHVSLQQAEAAPGTYKAVLGIPHGCDGEPTVSVRVEIPEGFVDAKPMPKPGWDLEIERGDYARTYKVHGEEFSSGALAVTWKGGSLPDDQYDEFTVRGTLAGVTQGERLFFKTIQTCSSGEQVAWVEEPQSGQDAHSLENPAPSVLIRAGGHAADRPSHGMSGEAKAGDLTITGAWARAMLPGQPTGGAYMTIGNAGKEPDRLIAVTSPAASEVEVHRMEMKGDVMIMRPVEGGLEIPAGASVKLEPGGLHLMFNHSAAPFKEGAEVPVTLEFERAGKVDLMLPVLPPRTGSSMETHH